MRSCSLWTTAMWEKTTEEVLLIKGEKGLGFSILDYQVKFQKFSYQTWKTCTIPNYYTLTKKYN